MWRSPGQTLVSLVLLKLGFVLVAHTLPFADPGPQKRGGWGESVRIRHLYTARRHGQESFFLRIHNDGRVDGDRQQSSHSLLEIRAVAAGSVVLKGHHSSLYLCMEADGKLYGISQDKYSQEDCSFEEEILPDGYNMYKSRKHGIAVSLSKDKHRQLYRGKGFLPLSHFLPMISWEPIDFTKTLVDEDDDYRFKFNTDQEFPIIDSLHLLQIIDSPSHQKK